MSGLLLFGIWLRHELREVQRDQEVDPLIALLLLPVVISIVGPVLVFYGVKDAFRTGRLVALAAATSSVLLSLLVASSTSWWWYLPCHLAMGWIGMTLTLWRAWQNERDGLVGTEESPESGPSWRFS